MPVFNNPDITATAVVSTGGGLAHDSGWLDKDYELACKLAQELALLSPALDPRDNVENNSPLNHTQHQQHSFHGYQNGFQQPHQNGHNNNNNANICHPPYYSNGVPNGGDFRGSRGSNSPDREGPPRRGDKKPNTTECVRVPSSEHVAEIVGRQGCKIKELRAKTNTYIKTPVRGEEPVFVVTGRKEDVKRAEQEIRMQSDHFSDIRANRHQERHLQSSGHDYKRSVPVPYKLVGLVVGPKGATIKKIQEETGAYIITPNRQAEPVFEVHGKQEEVENAARKILQHIQERTSMSLTSSSPSVCTRPVHGANPSSPSPAVSSMVGEFSSGASSQHNGFSQFNYAPLTNSFRYNSNSQQNSFSSQQNGYNSQQNGYSSQQNGFSSQSNGYASHGYGGSQHNGFSSPHNGFSNGYNSQNNGYSNGFGNDHASNGQQSGYSNGQHNIYNSGFSGFRNGFSSSNSLCSNFNDGVSNAPGAASGWAIGQNRHGQENFCPAPGAGLETRRSSGSVVEEDRVFNNVSSTIDYSIGATTGLSSTFSSFSGASSVLSGVLSGASGTTFGAFGGSPFDGPNGSFSQLSNSPGSDSGPALGPSGLCSTSSFVTDVSTSLLDSLPPFPGQPHVSTPPSEDPLSSVAHDLSRQVLAGDEEDAGDGNSEEPL